MMTPLRRVTGGGDQEKTTSLCPATASNISGAPAGAGNSKTNMYNKTVLYTAN